MREAKFCNRQTFDYEDYAAACTRHLTLRAGTSELRSNDERTAHDI